MKKILLLISLFLFPFSTIFADSINSIKMDIYVDPNGDANITEIWDVDINSGTEGYKPYYNIGNSEITDFTVTKNTREYTFESVWDIDASFQDKSYKNGINRIQNGVELCWGISNYGNNIYTLKYKITNFIYGLSDSDMAYWTFITYDLSLKPENVYIKIYSDFKYSDDLDVWGFGNYGGTAYVYDGYIEVASNEELDTNEYMTVLIKYPKGSFDTTENSDLTKEFESYLNQAQEGSTSYIVEKPSLISSIIEIIFEYLWVLIFFIIIILSLRKKSSKSAYKAGVNKLNKDVPFFRDIPCKGDIYRAYYTSYCFDLIKKKEDFLGAILLNWLKKDQIKIIKKQSDKLLKKESSSIVFVNVQPTTTLEQEIYKMMNEASVDGILEEYEFEKWCKKNYYEILNWFDKALNNENVNLVIDGSIKIDNEKVLGVFNKKVYSESPKFIEEAEQLYGLKKYLIEFSNMKDKEAMEVKLWNEYLIYAQIFGIAKKVAEQFKKLYPELISEYNYDSVIFIHDFSFSVINTANSARTEAERRASSYSSGGGGFSSGGGGGGSFGGGGGGGGFR